MGVVYEAVDRELSGRVALKVLPLGGRQQARHFERFLREARTAAGLHHTNIVPVFDVGQMDGVPYYAMQFIDGHGLDQLARAQHAGRPGDAARTDTAPHHASAAAQLATPTPPTSSVPGLRRPGPRDRCRW